MISAILSRCRLAPLGIFIWWNRRRYDAAVRRAQRSGFWHPDGVYPDGTVGADLDRVLARWSQNLDRLECARSARR